MIGRTLGRYRVVEKVGAGGMGVVYRAHDEQLDRDVAIKVLPAEAVADAVARERLLREARLASKLNHPNICTIYEVGEAGAAESLGPPASFIAMELVEGRPLSDRIGEAALPVEQVLRYGAQLADALGHAHERHVVHRDFKSANIVITPEGRAKILDFGLAKRLSDEALAEATTLSRHSLTAPGVVAGTLAYMAPEQLRGQAADGRSDIWALGVVLYEMASGVRPFRGQTGFELTSAILKDPPLPLPADMPAPLQVVVGRCLAKDPGERYQRASDVQAALEAIRAGTPAAPLAGRPSVLTRRRRIGIGAGVVLLFATGVLVVTLNVGGLRTPPPAPPARVIQLAVLPFENPGGNPDQEYFSDGQTEEMIRQLSRLHPETLRVKARASVMRYKKTEKPIDQVARELGVEYVLEGSAQVASGQVQISAELIKVADQTQLWGERYTRAVSAIPALQSEVAQGVAKALALKLLPAEQSRLATTRVVNPEAYEAYLKGNQQFYRVPEGLDRALQYYELALQKDPDYAPAHAGIALYWAGRNQMGLTPPAEAVPKAKAAALKAVALDDSLAETHWALAGVLSWHEWKWAAAEVEFKRAIELNPNYPDVRAFYSHFLHIMGRHDEAMPHILRAVELDPFNSLFQGFYAQNLVFSGRYDEGIEQARKTLKMDPNARFAKAALWSGLEAKGADAEAYGMALADDPDDHELVETLERGHAEGGYRGAMRRAAELMERRARTTHVRSWDIASVWDSAGDLDRALDWMERALQERDPGLPYVVMPAWKDYSKIPRFQAIVREMGLAPQPRK